jgi:putative toxin-antitoxin system antitoxin component (TIGR02293 family)
MPEQPEVKSGSEVYSAEGEGFVPLSGKSAQPKWEGVPGHSYLLRASKLVTAPESAAAPEPVGIGEVVEIVARTMEVFGDRIKALRWLRTPLPSLGDATPQEMLERDGGIEQVEEVLGRIEHGVW